MTAPAFSFTEPIQTELALVEEALGAARPGDFPWLDEMLKHVMGVGGKRLRPTIALLAGQFGDYQPDKLVPLAASIELLHTATLVHDDVIDASDTRRGRETINSRYHNAAAVMLGDYMFAHAANLICQTESIEVVRVFSRTLMSMASGELTQDMSAYEYGQDTMKYFNRIAGKTASLYATSAHGGALVAGAQEDWKEALRSYGENVGMAFQIVDDILDFTGDEEELGKPAGSDLMQGTLTLPSILLMERYPNGNPVKALFENKGSHEHLEEALELVRSSDVLESSHSVARDFHNRAVENLAVLPNLPAKAALVDIADYVLGRRN
jgi:geranylgeranyl pyrophosphate synthase